ncbi:acyltransferase [Klebsiella michiganensis]|uniref:acyltransferase family protein n=1 Tax=Klebsiella michiganensis TaxID=1134687 RepID=UPI0032DAAEAF
MAKQEIKSLTGLRGIAAVTVMFYHFNLAHALTSHSATIMGHGYLMVDLFFVLSGFVISMTYGEWFANSIDRKAFLKYVFRRIARIYPLYFFMICTASILVATGWMDRWPGPAVIVSALINFSMLQTLLGVPTLNTPGWSVSAEWVASILFPFISFLFQRYGWKLILLFFVVSILVYPFIAIAPALIHEPKRSGIMDIWHYETIYPVIRAVAGFIVGMVLFNISKLDIVMKIIMAPGLSLCMLLFIIFSMTFKNADFIIIALFPIFVLSLVNEKSLVGRLMSSKLIYRLGVLSYSIYLIHNQLNYFMLIIKSHILSEGINEQGATILSCILFALITILLSEITFRYVEKPARDYLRKMQLFTPREPSAAK